MAHANRNTRHKQRIRRNLSLANRQLRELQKAHFNTHLTLLMILAQRGGEVVVTQGTMQQTIQGIQGLNWQTFPGDNPNEFVVRLLVKEPGDSVEPSDAPEPQPAPDAGPTNISEMARIEEPTSLDIVDEQASVPESLYADGGTGA